MFMVTIMKCFIADCRFISNIHLLLSDQDLITDEGEKCMSKEMLVFLGTPYFTPAFLSLCLGYLWRDCCTNCIAFDILYIIAHKIINVITNIYHCMIFVAIILSGKGVVIGKYNICIVIYGFVSGLYISLRNLSFYILLKP